MDSPTRNLDCRRRSSSSDCRASSFASASSIDRAEVEADAFPCAVVDGVPASRARL